MDLRQIECFLCLFQQGNVTRAAKQLGIVQSALSTQISKLEKDLDIRLFDRSSRGVTPTTAGEKLHKMLLPLAREVDSIQQQMLDLGGEASGLVRVGLAPSLGVNVVPNALSRYCVDFPNVTIQLSVGYTNILIENLDAGKIDFAITNDTPKLGSLISSPIMSEELVLVVACNSKFLTSSIPDFNQIPPGRLIVPSSGQVLRSLIDDHLRKTGKTMQSHLELDALMPTMELVKTGEWATILPVSAISRDLENKVLCIARITDPIHRELISVYHPRRPLSLAAQNLLQAFETEVKRVGELANQTLQKSTQA
ncbi:LysR family transcriptional regulator [Advenella sp. WQ 585]|uniref:LysR family transcriptional regulator n=1 Tax=Advenella mandrilli TaxID=2800330 RepID=A0ABS1E9F4_9BURK|nr:LysR family transcriptional regulator [Advenella mandrilli]MBK1780407.1 LysR family transcriptional regulator [Advenella mandrilli]